MWEEKDQSIMQSISIPRGLSLLAGGQYEQKDGQHIFTVKASKDDDTFGILQSPFMKENAQTKQYQLEMIVTGNTLKYRQEMSLFIYGKPFQHVDESVLHKVSYDS